MEAASKFNATIDNTDVMELPTSRGFFTWLNNSQGHHRVWSRIDRMLGNACKVGEVVVSFGGTLIGWDK